MTMTRVPPPADVAEQERVSRCLLHFRASDVLTETVDGRVGAFSRGATGLVADPAGATFTIGYTQPAWETLPWTGAVQSMFLRLSVNDRLHFACDWRPQALGFYHEFKQNGAMAANDTALWSICNDAASGARLVLDSTGTYYRLRHHNGSVERTVTLAVAPSASDIVVMWGYLYADGSIQLWQSIAGNASTNTNASSSNTLASTWASTSRVRLSALGTSAGAASHHRIFKLVPGLPTLAQLQQAF